jgi:hypothetical protein
MSAPPVCPPTLAGRGSALMRGQETTIGWSVGLRRLTRVADVDDFDGEVRFFREVLEDRRLAYEAPLSFSRS